MKCLGRIGMRSFQLVGIQDSFEIVDRMWDLNIQQVTF